MTCLIGCSLSYIHEPSFVYYIFSSPSFSYNISKMMLISDPWSACVIPSGSCTSFFSFLNTFTITSTFHAFASGWVNGRNLLYTPAVFASTEPSEVRFLPCVFGRISTSSFYLLLPYAFLVFSRVPARLNCLVSSGETCISSSKLISTLNLLANSR